MKQTKSDSVAPLPTKPDSKVKEATSHISSEVPTTLYWKLRRKAETQERSMSAELRVALGEWTKDVVLPEQEAATP